MQPLALVIENDAGTRKLLDVLLTRSGFDTDLASRSHEALALLGSVDYDAVLIDDDTIAVVRWMSAHRAELLPRVVHLACTPRVQVEGIRVVRKPFELAQVIEAARAACEGHERRDGGAAEHYCRRSVRAGAKAGLLARRDGDHVSLVSAFGYTREVLEPWFPIPLSDSYPLCDSIRDARSRWFPSLDAVRTEYPALTEVWEKNQTRALATVPLLREGSVIGGAGWSFDAPHRFDEPERQLFADIAGAAASALDVQSDTHTHA